MVASAQIAFRDIMVLVYHQITEGLTQKNKTTREGGLTFFGSATGNRTPLSRMRT